tara:strand:+ start:2022 stop:3368 length:1347 start_codon:yes stop_codon:yes gene_type:complete
MIRAAVLFLQILLIIGLSVWLAKEPGYVSIVWRNWQVDTSVGILVVAVGLVAIATTLAFRFWQFLTQTPGRLLTNRRAGRERRGYREITDGMLALASGDAANAMKHARRAGNFLGRPAAASHLIVAEAAVLQGNLDLAKKHFEVLLEDEKTAVAGARGLLARALDVDDRGEALRLAEKVRSIDSEATWVLSNLFDLQVNAREWGAADITMDEAIKRRSISSAKGRRLRALVLYERGMASAEINDNDTAVGFFREALDLDPSLPYAAIEYSKLLLQSGKKRRSQRVLEQSWVTTRHPDIVEQLLAVAVNDERVDRYKMAQKLISQNLDADSSLILAGYAFEANLWGEARKYVGLILQERSSVGACELMAKIENKESMRIDVVGEWQEKSLTAAPDKAWICSNCLSHAENWVTICHSCGGFGRIEWQFPIKPTASKTPLSARSIPFLTNF